MTNLKGFSGHLTVCGRKTIKTFSNLICPTLKSVNWRPPPHYTDSMWLQFVMRTWRSHDNERKSFTRDRLNNPFQRQCGKFEFLSRMFHSDAECFSSLSENCDAWFSLSFSTLSLSQQWHQNPQLLTSDTHEEETVKLTSIDDWMEDKNLKLFPRNKIIPENKGINVVIYPSSWNRKIMRYEFRM